tara:strand:+ start:248 stop:592 length:345 start_codon:yes stop_codon:yes gene_type:complete
MVAFPDGNPDPPKTDQVQTPKTLKEAIELIEKEFGGDEEFAGVDNLYKEAVITMIKFGIKNEASPLTTFSVFLSLVLPQLAGLTAERTDANKQRSINLLIERANKFINDLENAR